MEINSTRNFSRNITNVLFPLTCYVCACVRQCEHYDEFMQIRLRTMWCRHLPTGRTRESRHVVHVDNTIPTTYIMAQHFQQRTILVAVCKMHALTCIIPSHIMGDGKWHRRRRRQHHRMCSCVPVCRRVRVCAFVLERWTKCACELHQLPNETDGRTLGADLTTTPPLSLSLSSQV